MEIGWKFALQANKILQNYHRFGVLTKIIGYRDESPRMK